MVQIHSKRDISSKFVVPFVNLTNAEIALVLYECNFNMGLRLTMDSEGLQFCNYFQIQYTKQSETKHDLELISRVVTKSLSCIGGRMGSYYL